MNIDQLVAQATALRQDSANSKWEEIYGVWDQIKARHPRVSFKGSIGDMTAPGWWKVLDETFTAINEIMAPHPTYTFHVLQIKEKFGGLRFYWRLGNSEVEEADDEILVHDDELYTELSYQLGKVVDRAEEVCGHTCEICGEPGELRPLGWLRTLCDTHHQERLKEQK